MSESIGLWGGGAQAPFLPTNNGWHLDEGKELDEEGKEEKKIPKLLG